MSDDLNRHLDGELPLEGLTDEARRQAQAWERLLGAFRAESPPGSAPPWLETRIMAEIEALPEPGLLKRGLDWLLGSRPIRVSPLTVGLVTAGLAVALFASRPGAVVSGPGGGDPGGGFPAQAAGAGSVGVEPVVYVQFVLNAPGATSVVVAGDFDGWEGANALEDADGDGVWTGRVPVRPGVHAYMFLVNGSDWRTDPLAGRYAEDGFGNRNAILAVAAPTI